MGGTCSVCDAARRTQRRGSPAQSPAFDRFRAYQHQDYVNIYSLPGQAGQDRVFGTESLYGDWHGRALLLAKDYAPVRVIHARMQRDDPDPYRAGCRCKKGWDGPDGMGYATNHRLAALTGGLNVGMVYGSAFGGLMRGWSAHRGNLKGFREVAEDYAKPLIDAVMASMPNVAAVACLGADAWQCVTQLAQQRAEFPEHRDRSMPIDLGGIPAFALPHPVHSPGGKTAVERLWRSFTTAASS